MNRFTRDLRGVAPYLTAGDGGLEETLRALRALERAGACAAELGVPFSDPIADGPLLQAAAQRALAAGTDLRGILRMVEGYRAGGGALPLALMSYANVLQRCGWNELAAEARHAGVDALIVPDLPVEEASSMRCAAEAHAIGTVFFVAPTSGAVRLAAACEASTAFVYALGRVGVTGAATRFDASTVAYLQRVRARSRVPVAVGFGLKSASDVSAALAHADLAIVGSALVQHLHEARAAGRDAAAAAEQFLIRVRGEVDSKRSVT